MRNPKEAQQESAADKTPMKPSQALERTQSPIMTEPTLKRSMTVMVTPKKGTTEFVFFSNSVSSVWETKRATVMVSNSRFSMSFRSSSSQSADLEFIVNVREGRMSLIDGIKEKKIQVYASIYLYKKIYKFTYCMSSVSVVCRSQ